MPLVPTLTVSVTILPLCPRMSLCALGLGLPSARRETSGMSHALKAVKDGVKRNGVTRDGVSGDGVSRDAVSTSLEPRLHLREGRAGRQGA